MLLGEALNYLFGLEALLIAAVLPRRNVNILLYKYFLRLFLSISFSCFMWSIYNGQHFESANVQRLICDICLISLGLTTVTLWFICIHLCFQNLNHKSLFGRIIKSVYVLFIFTILMLRDDFFTVLIFYLPPTSFFLFIMLTKYYKTFHKRLLFGVLGAAFTIVGAGFEQLFHCQGGHGTECARNVLFIASNSLAIFFVFLAAQQLLAPLDAASHTSHHSKTRHK